ncbi:MAG: hypothetical protein N3A69_00470 [Leptospiraceae bacterium]|nr:hypothetical protein [Leptospiraceae bacterium]
MRYVKFIKGLFSLFLLFAMYYFRDFWFGLASVIPWSDGYDTSGSRGKRAKTGSFQERTRVAEEPIPFGSPLALGTTGEQVKVLASATDIFAGIAVYDPYSKGIASNRYETGEPLVVAYEGIYWVYVDEGVNEKYVVRARIVNHASDPNKLKGNFCKTTETGKTVILEGAYFDGSRSNPGTVPLRLSDSIKIIAD